MLSRTLTIPTNAREQILIVTSEVSSALSALTDGDGICTLFTPHTTTAVSINENADPDVPADLVRALRAMIPAVRFEHGEGNSDAHLLSMLIGSSISVPFRKGRMLLGRWQGIYFIELDGPRERELQIFVPQAQPA